MCLPDDSLGSELPEDTGLTVGTSDECSSGHPLLERTGGWQIWCFEHGAKVEMSLGSTL